MSERESLALVGAAGIAVTEVVAVTDAAAAVRAARTIGRPVALKLDAVGLAHKSDVGGVALGLRGDDAVYGAALTLLEIGRRRGLTVRGLLVEPMAPPGVELILGLRRDPQFGPAVLVGLGGVLTEVLDDVAVRLAPIDAAAAEAMLDDLRGVAHPRRRPRPARRRSGGARRDARRASVASGWSARTSSRSTSTRSSRRPAGRSRSTPSSSWRARPMPADEPAEPPSRSSSGARRRGASG